MAGIWSASKARRTSSPAICPSAFPRSMSAMTETDSAISGGSVRDVLADTNNLSERWKTASGPVRDGREPTTGLEWADGAGEPGDAQRRERRPYSLRGCHLLGHRVAPTSVTPNPRGPSHTP
ncbi:hypothetical protein SAM23877_5526 [Streptomyces ambofaciens ATCC 23877]|uniref:Uncharacterized protein n=1 Tax=Streptomyces ambofaciens (strain ATCC 23877 / 3486 / DSM 40053 / JCM 4204 / NBRC 12836 / NRRL B-2516) TaxID=278992 RepID=A0A0K2B0A6_STRA7|nr:hypothetical protein SAM23877_5526 [Streptomyces ambofaciens ATCC 23877]